MKFWLVGGALVVALLVVANAVENRALRRQAALVAGDSVAAQQSHVLDSAARAHFADTLRLRRTLDSLARVQHRVRVVTIARTDTLRAAIPDSLVPVLDSVVAGYEAELALKDSVIALLTFRGQQSDSLLRGALGNRDEWRTQAQRWRKEATRWRLKLGPFTVRPCGGYGLTPAGGQVFAGACLTP